jgi:ribosomal protein L29
MEKFSIIKLGAIVTAMVVISGATVKALDYTDLKPVLSRDFRPAIAQLEAQIENLSQAQLLLKFQQLEQKLKFGPLSFEEAQERCRIARVLDYDVPGCRL